MTLYKINYSKASLHKTREVTTVIVHIHFHTILIQDYGVLFAHFLVTSQYATHDSNYNKINIIKIT